MNIEEFRDYCMSKPGVTEETPFGPDTLVFKVMGKMFALTGLNLFESINLKCGPQTAIDLRERYESVVPGYHMNKEHWNTIYVNRELSDEELKKWIDHSFDLVVQTLPKSKQVKLKSRQS